MEIRFISSLTADDENLFAPALLKAVATLLDQMPLAYTIRIETTGAQILQHSHAAPRERQRLDTPEALTSPMSPAVQFLARANGTTHG